MKHTTNINPTESKHLWFIAQDSVMKGPFTTAQIQEKLSQREFSHFDYCWRQGFREWRPIASIHESFDVGPHADIPSYPQIETPNSGRPTHVDNKPITENNTTSTARATKQSVFPTRNRAYVNFKQNRKSAWSIYEWAAAVIFATATAYIVNTMSLNEIQRRFFQKWELTQAGSIQNIGDSSETPHMHPSAWDPIATAPGLRALVTKDIADLNPHAPKYELVLPVEIFGTQKPSTSETTVTSEGQNFELKGAVELWNPARYELDPIYIRPIELKGYLSLENTKSIWVHNPSSYVR